MDIDLSHKNALVCGATQGIGRACAVELAALGARVTVMARNETRLKEVASELPTPAGQSHDILVADFSEPSQVRQAVEGRPEPTYHILVNNTGGPPGGTILGADEEALERAFRMHVINNQAIMTALVPGMKAAGYGRIINIISTSVKAPIAGLGVSNTIRAAVANWAKTLASELAPFGITVNNVLPGFTDTARLAQLFDNKATKLGKSLNDVRDAAVASIPAGRLGRPEEIAAGAAFLATPAAAYINGTNLTIDGGRTQSL